jgi:predicted ArsR family transcriptional regulator
MSNRVRDDTGEYTGKLTEQDLLKAFDYETTAEEPMLKVSELVAALETHFDIEVSGQTVRRHLQQMEDDGQVASKQFGASAVGWTALVGPRLAEDVRADAEDARLEDAVSLEEVAEDVGIDLN